ncbi:enoyl-CoA hydratase-related protein [Mesorhizobium amorphae]|uniref:Enoyl-CoA hydratase, putative n=1 Tax=Mesorhizobium amorphae CCNWGS0123 TaxID=1082933 RepID=G6Y3E1_9HYPH|nr:enoyl-CoA hydratase-related protein [Mesorhizobium amorphae]ANT54830.1 enoyl-CoA hydratase [Mesorhizobium amorphae CCNWGS0123]EHH13742.1 enoyl-CoA hydratase, putative [Mesorhizobium amorphae CCNWGS0123]
MYKEILYTVDNFIATITLNRPDRLNALTPQMESEIRAATDLATADDNVRAIVVTGAGRGFCAGADVSLLTPGVSEDLAGNPYDSDQTYSYLLTVPKPIFMAINGVMAGAGVIFAAFGDFRYMADGAKLTTSFARRGLVAEFGISWLLPRLIGTMNALDLLCSARVVEAREADRLGLVRTLQAENFLATVQGIAREMVTMASPRSIGVIKRQIYDSYFQSLDEASAFADEEMRAAFASEDYIEGVAHFVEKRAPNFTGR